MKRKCKFRSQDSLLDRRVTRWEQLQIDMSVSDFGIDMTLMFEGYEITDIARFVYDICWANNEAEKINRYFRGGK